MTGDARDLVQGHIYYFGVWEPSLTEFIRRRLAGHGDRTFVDVGANVGYFSLLAAQRLPKGKVVSIEAFPPIYAKLSANVQLNRLTNVRLVPCAATHTDCELEMYHGGGENEGATTAVAGKFEVPPIRVPGRPLATILSDEEVRSLRLMKIDVEGAEHSVVLGLQPLLERFPSDAEIVVEITPSALGKVNMAEVFSVFESAGYFPYVLENSYSAEYYLHSQKVSTPRRMKEMPVEQTDVVFSRLNAESL